MLRTTHVLGAAALLVAASCAPSNQPLGSGADAAAKVYVADSIFGMA